MKKQRRVIAMVLVIAFAFALMAMNVSAATPRATCPSCGGLDVTYYTVLESTKNVNVTSCSNSTDYHVHTIKTYHNHFICRSCTYEYDGVSWTETTCRA